MPAKAGTPLWEPQGKRGPSFSWGDGRKAERATMTTSNKPWHDSLPFPKRWLAYIALKLIVLALAVYLALHLKGLV